MVDLTASDTPTGYMQDLRSKRLRELEAEEGSGSADEEFERDVWLTQIHLRTLKAANLLGSLKQVCCQSHI